MKSWRMLWSINKFNKIWTNLGKAISADPTIHNDGLSIKTVFNTVSRVYPLDRTVNLEVFVVNGSYENKSTCAPLTLTWYRVIPTIIFNAKI